MCAYTQTGLWLDNLELFLESPEIIQNWLHCFRVIRFSHLRFMGYVIYLPALPFLSSNSLLVESHQRSF